MAELFENQRRTWEMELLISGAVVFALFQVPSALDTAFAQLEIHLTETQKFTSVFGFVYTKMIVLVLTTAFLLHLTTRAFWIGLIGLRAVYPHGIDWDEMHEGPVWTDILRQMPSLGDLAEATDRLASRIFSFAFLFVLFFALSIAYVAPIALLSWLLQMSLFPEVKHQTIFLVLLVIVSLPSVLATSYDKRLKKRGEEPSPRMRRLLEPSLRFYHRTSLGSLIKPILYVFTSNLRRRRAYVLMIVAFSILYFVVFGDLIAAKMDRQLIHGYSYLPPREGELAVRHRYYENLRQPGPTFARVPSLSSDVADTTFLKVFLPYVPAEDNRTLEEKCPDLETWPWRFKPPSEPPPREEEEAALACLEKLYELELDGEPWTPRFELYRHPQTRARGLLAYLRTADLEPGRHLLRITEVDVEREKPHVHNMPFYR